MTDLDPQLPPIDYDQLARLRQTDYQYVYMIAPSPRPGVLVWGVAMEFYHFNPYPLVHGSPNPRNDPLSVHFVQWGDMVHHVLSIPKDRHHLAIQMADRLGLRAAEEYAPIMIDVASGSVTGEPTDFPLQGKGIYYLLYKHGSPMYRLGPDESSARLAREQKVVKDMLFDRTVEGLPPIEDLPRLLDPDL